MNVFGSEIIFAKVIDFFFQICDETQEGIWIQLSCEEFRMVVILVTVYRRLQWDNDRTLVFTLGEIPTTSSRWSDKSSFPHPQTINF